MERVLYLIGSLRNPRIPELARRIREENPDVEVFDDWYAAGPEADDCWKEYEQARGRTYKEALAGLAAKNVFAFDRRNLDRASHTLLVLPAGKSGHMEAMYACYGVGSNTAILLDPEDVRWDVMYQFIPTVLGDDSEIKGWLDGRTDCVGADRGGSSLLSGLRVGEVFEYKGEKHIVKEQLAGGGLAAQRISDGGWLTRLLSERPSRDCPPFQVSWGETHSGGASSLEEEQEYRP